MKYKFSLSYKIIIHSVSSQRAVFAVTFLFLLTCLTSCEKNFDINVNSNQPMLVVEAYINNEMRAYNYVILSRSLDYLSLDFQSTPVPDAIVTITEGERVGESYIWDTTNKVQLKSLYYPGVSTEV